MEPITKRLHVSGLTPAISADDLSRRLSGFGSVKALDGFGKLDDLGQPRKYGYVTIETTKGQLAKCLNVLSGSTWKGTKLRIGEAKPDFRERYIDLERMKADAEPPKKKRRRENGVHAEDMSLVTPEDANKRGGWRVTPMGRVVRPLRMRPARPLEPQIAVTRGIKKAGPNGKEKRKRVKAPATRARRRTIDPTKWDSVHLKGMFLDADGVIIPREEVRQEAVRDGSISESEDSSSEDSNASALEAMEDVREAPIEELLRQDSNQHPYTGDDMQVEEVPIEEVIRSTQILPPEMESEPPNDAESSRTAATAPTQMTKLKDLFAPREEEAGFSLLGHLDFDLELDDDVINTLPIQTQTVSSTTTSEPSALPETIATSYADQITFDSNLPFFFPFSSEFRDSLRPRDRVRIKDMFDVAKEKGWDWRTAGFYRTQTEDEIRQQWEDSKVELTREWKKRHREAGKSRRRRGGGDGD
ncbi:hypothetical protein BJ138DRAFT_1009253 [Hygrophoropsis aurantiaca]|uniref:Uncharacterized protein n=1 Tax=Hygrophoropsis aurantiaca TaxID=72124 RepID=A0ACB8AAJ5_9AGAM|nr:hypothetical protein BJ138DRAFT_1009253 [Hygrophoropsis aurantiaca]